MAETTHADRIQMLEDIDEDIPLALLMLEREGPALSVHTGESEDAVKAQLNLIATHINWLAQITEVPPKKVAQDALEIAVDYQDDGMFTDISFQEYQGREE